MAGIPVCRFDELADGSIHRFMVDDDFPISDPDGAGHPAGDLEVVGGAGQPHTAGRDHGHVVEPGMEVGEAEVDLAIGEVGPDEGVAIEVDAKVGTPTHVALSAIRRGHRRAGHIGPEPKSIIGEQAEAGVEGVPSRLLTQTPEAAKAGRPVVPDEQRALLPEWIGLRTVRPVVGLGKNRETTHGETLV